MKRTDRRTPEKDGQQYVAYPPACEFCKYYKHEGRLHWCNLGNFMVRKQAICLAFQPA